MEQKRVKPWIGIVFLAVVMAVTYFICFPIQRKIGLWGLAVTELILLALAIGVTLLFKQKLKEVFPVRLPKLREIFGLLIFFLGGFILALIASMIMVAFFPQQMQEVSTGLNSTMTSEGVLLGILISSIMPAFCEEAVHRGFILHTFKGVKKEWVVVLVMGLLFGAFHLSSYRFLTTAVLGGCITWVMLKTKNIVMPMLYHAINNLFPVLIGFAMKDALEAATAVTENGAAATVATTVPAMPDWMTAMSSIGVSLMFTLLALPLMLAGTALMKKKGDKVKGKHVAAVFIIAGGLFIIGIGLIIGCSVYLVATQGIGM